MVLAASPLACVRCARPSETQSLDDARHLCRPLRRGFGRPATGWTRRFKLLRPDCGRLRSLSFGPGTLTCSNGLELTALEPAAELGVYGPETALKRFQRL